MIKSKKVYIAMASDFLHHGHVNIIEKAAEYGDLTIGLLTDRAIASYKRVPFLDFKDRSKILMSIESVKKVIPQQSLDYTENLIKIKPDFVLHGDDWKNGVQKETRNKVIKTLKKWNGKLIEIPYTENISSTKILNEFLSNGSTADIRIGKLRRYLQVKKCIKLIEVHSGLSGLVAEKSFVKHKNGNVSYFDGFWSSSLVDSTVRGKPDNESVSLTDRIRTINEIFEVTSKPLIYDGDNGGTTDIIPYTIRTLERTGVSGIIIEDKKGIKRNSLFGTKAKQNQDSIENFSKKIKVAKKSQITEEFVVIARVESLILKQGMKDALKRSYAYIKAGADGIMIHSSQQSPEEIKQFCREFRKKNSETYLIVVPTTYNSIYESELEKLGVNIIIYANQLIRSIYPAMQKTSELILKNGRSKEASKYLTKVKEIINLIPFASDD